MGTQVWHMKNKTLNVTRTAEALAQAWPPAEANTFSRRWKGTSLQPSGLPPAGGGGAEAVADAAIVAGRMLLLFLVHVFWHY
jgi:hypothetical protein